MDTIPTIKIEADTELGYLIINARDFDAETMKEYVEPAAAPAAEE